MTQERDVTATASLDAPKPPPRMRKSRNRALWIMLSAGALFATAFVAYKWWTRPTVVTVAVSETNADDMKIMTAFSRVLSAGGRRGVILSVQPVPTPADAVAAFRDRKTDMAVVRADADLRGQGNAIAILRKNYGVVISLDPKIDSIAKLRGKKVGVMGPPGLNDAFVNALLHAYDIPSGEIIRLSFEGFDAAKVSEAKGVSALIGVSSIALGRSSDAMRAVLRARKNLKMTFLAVDRAADIVRMSPFFVEEDLEKGAFSGLPSEEVSTVSLNTYLVARSSMSNETAAALARQFLSNKGAVIADAPAAAQIEAPAAERDAYMRTHPGVLNYLNNEEQTFFDKYGDLVYILMAVGGVFGSGFVALRRSIGPDTEADACDLIDEFVDLRRSVRAKLTQSTPDLASLRQAWRDATATFEELLSRALPLIGDSKVDERTAQALSTAVTTTERAIADLAAMIVGANGAYQEAANQANQDVAKTAKMTLI
jgi:TRAP-type uncharacterized transport system substrate-binding protein